MRSFWFDPYLWIHLAGIAAVPLFLELCLAGLAIGDPWLPVWLELFLIAAVGIVPILWMQWQRPFYIFSIVAVAVRPEQLTEDQRRLLTLFKFQRNRLLAAVVAIVLIAVLRQLYVVAPVVAPIAPFSLTWRGVGLLLAAIAFLGANLFLQVPVSVASVMLTDESTFATTTPYAVEQIRQSFTLIGLQIDRLLPPLFVAPKPVASVADSLSPTALAVVETDDDPWDTEPPASETSLIESNSQTEASTPDPLASTEASLSNEESNEEFLSDEESNYS